MNMDINIVGCFCLDCHVRRNGFSLLTASLEYLYAYKSCMPYFAFPLHQWNLLDCCKTCRVQMMLLVEQQYGYSPPEKWVSSRRDGKQQWKNMMTVGQIHIRIPEAEAVSIYLLATLNFIQA
eukprot:TRINITY_DN152_c1_g2_i1.p1 TRINITY_DN152_c1_g2~~TRINITY_DN152_c1_g2_i1.p1  ORF type:complete len:122 (+),score=15.90 TRINITY_DN152_c1_g2_i1:594-959(+)